MKKFLIGLIIVVALPFGLYRLVYPNYSWNQKITIELETPYGVKSASSVSFIKVKQFWTPSFLGRTGDDKQTGEAVVLELATDRYLFLLLAENTIATRVYRENFESHGMSIYQVASDIDRLRAAKLIPPEYYPKFVTFEDIDDPTSVKEVDPADLAATFGSGYALKSITLEITDDPVTEGEVEKVLGWLNDLKQYRTDPNNPFTNTLPREIGSLRSK